MRNILKTQWYLCKQRKGLVGAIWISAVAIFMFFVLSKSNIADVFDGCLLAVFVISALPAFMIAATYGEKIQIYEITSGYKPHEIIFGKALAYLPFTVLFLIIVFIASFLKFGVTSLIPILLFCILVIRMVLCIILLSPLTKEGAWAPLFTGIIPTFFSDIQVLRSSPVSLLAAGQCMLLNQPIDNAFVFKVIVSSIISCIICYIVGHMVIKKKFDLEPRKN